MNISKWGVWLVTVTLVFSLAGCGMKQNVATIDAKYYPECYDPIAKLCKDQDNTKELKGAATGALVGALGGALVGGLASKDWKGAAVGAVAGAAAGGMTGFFAGRLSKISDQKQRLAEYQKMLGEESKNWDIERASVEKAYKCYREQIKILKANYKAKKINKEEFLARTNEIKAGIENINTYWADAEARMNSALADGEAFVQEEEQKAQQAAQKKNVQSARATTAQVKNSIMTKNNSVNKQKQEANTELAGALEYIGADSQTV